jgi:raffinose/stachyose/melibiose transport system permease protein
MGVYTVFVLAPFCYALYLSFFNWGGVGPMTFAGFSNYTALWEQPGISVSFLHAAILIAFFAALPILIALLLTALMSREPIRGLTFYRTVLFLPQVVALVAIAVVWDWILAPAGPVNTVLRDIGLGFLAQDWLGSFTWALPAVGIIGSWVGYGFAMVVFMAGVEKIPQSLYDAARVDGAGAVREFFAVTLPSLRNELTVVLVLTVTGSFTTFDIVYILTSGGPGTSTVVPAYSVFDLAFTDYRVGAAAAAGVVLALIVFVLAVVIMHLNRTAEESSRA